MKTVFKIYLITNLTNGKRYVGFTSLSIKNRIRLHISNARGSVKKYENGGVKPSPLQYAFLKYGQQNFSVEWICSSLDYDTIIELEKHFIKEYRCREHGYNCSEGGEGHTGRVQSDEERAMRSRMFKDIQNRPEQKTRQKDHWNEHLAQHKGANHGMAQMWCVENLDTGETEYVKGLRAYIHEKLTGVADNPQNVYLKIYHRLVTKTKKLDEVRLQSDLDPRLPNLRITKKP